MTHNEPRRGIQETSAEEESRREIPKGPEQPGKKREGEREGGTGKRGPRIEAGRDHEPSECGASDTPHPRLVAEPPGINGASANGPLERVTLCRRKVLGTLLHHAGTRSTRIAMCETWRRR